MMGRQAVDQSQLFYLFNLEGHIPTDHLLRRINPIVTRVQASFPSCLIHRNAGISLVTRVTGLLIAGHIRGNHVMSDRRTSKPRAEPAKSDRHEPLPSNSQARIVARTGLTLALVGLALWIAADFLPGCAPTCGTNKIVHRLLQLRATPCVGLLVMTRFAAALWASPGSSRGATRRGVGAVGLAWLVISFT
jgi:hypothetical protein